MTAYAAIPPEISSLITGIDHVGIAVPDLAEALQFYEGILGLHSHHTETNVEQGVEEAMLDFPAGVEAGAEIQLLSPLGPDTTIGRFIAKNGPGIQQLALRVTDIHEVANILKQRGIRMLYAEPKIGTAGSLVNFAHPKDCGGVLLEFVQH
jgi:methylmalonyl-CoA/ethylmalonyl-CoA epimerase